MSVRHPRQDWKPSRGRPECPPLRPREVWRTCRRITCRHHMWSDAQCTAINTGRPIPGLDEVAIHCALDVAGLESSIAQTDQSHGSLTLDQVGNILGVGRERVRQIELQALKRLRRFGIALGVSDRP